MSCIQVPQLPTTLPLGITLGVPKAGIGIDLAINFCCHFNLPLSLSTDDLIALLQAVGINIHTISLNVDVLKPIQAYLIAANKYIKKLEFDCPLN